MPKYGVHFCLRTQYYIEVEADNEDYAVEIAYDIRSDDTKYMLDEEFAWCDTAQID